MAKMRIGHDPRKKTIQRLERIAIPEAAELAPMEEIKHFDEADLMLRLQAMVDAKPTTINEPKIVETVIVKEVVSKLDKRARQHSKAVSARSKMASIHIQALNLKIEAMEEEIVEKHNKLVDICEKMALKIRMVESRKPEEKQVVIERNIATRIEHKVPKHVYIALAVSLLLNIVVLLK